VLHELAGLQVDHLAGVGGAAEVLDAFEVELLEDARLADDVDLLGRVELDRLEVGGGGVRGRVDLVLVWVGCCCVLGGGVWVVRFARACSRALF
jgi:hypothetical protein